MLPPQVILKESLQVSWWFRPSPISAGIALPFPLLYKDSQGCWKGGGAQLKGMAGAHWLTLVLPTVESYPSVNNDHSRVDKISTINKIEADTQHIKTSSAQCRLLNSFIKQWWKCCLNREKSNAEFNNLHAHPAGPLTLPWACVCFFTQTPETIIQCTFQALALPLTDKWCSPAFTREKR